MNLIKTSKVVDIDFLEVYTNFPNDIGVNNVEFGASINYFGKKFYPKCYLTDLKDNGLPHFTKTNKLEHGICHFLDTCCDFFNFNLNGRKFDNLIFCNPYGFGLSGRGNAKLFLNRAGEMLNDGGNIHLFTHSTNKWGNFESAEKYIRKLTDDNELKYELVIEEKHFIDENHLFRNGMVYTQVNIQKETKPNEFFTIKKVGNV